MTARHGRAQESAVILHLVEAQREPPGGGIDAENTFAFEGSDGIPSEFLRFAGDGAGNIPGWSVHQFADGVFLHGFNSGKRQHVVFRFDNDDGQFLDACQIYN